MSLQPCSNGERFGRLVVLGRPETAYIGGHIAHDCLCDCGKRVVVTRSHLRSGHTQSCGCLGLERRVASRQSHRRSGTLEYRIWRNMISRCTNPNIPAHRIYGARGITVCDRWMESFQNFYADMGPCPLGLTLDRKNNNGAYSPENCRWASRKEQARNMRVNVRAVINGKAMCLAEIAQEFGLDQRLIVARHHRGWRGEKLISPVQSKYSHSPKRDGSYDGREELRYTEKRS